MMSNNASNKSNRKELRSRTAAAKRDQVVEGTSDLTEQSEVDETDSDKDQEKTVDQVQKKTIDQDQKKKLVQDLKKKIDQDQKKKLDKSLDEDSNQTESEAKKSSSYSLPANMHLTVTIVSSFVTATLVTFIFRVALPPDNNGSSIIIPKELHQCHADLNKSVELSRELQQKCDLNLNSNTKFNQTVMEVNMNLQSLNTSQTMLLNNQIKMNNTQIEMNNTLMKLSTNQEEFVGNQIEMNNTQIEMKKTQIEMNKNQTEMNNTQMKLSSSQEELGTKLVEMNNTQREQAKQLVIIGETKQQTQLSTDYSWREIVMAVICGLLLELPVTILVMKWCFSSHDDYSDQPQKTTLNRNNSSGGQLHHSAINRQNTFMNDGTGKELKRGVTVLSCDSGTLSKSHALVSELVRGQTVQRAQVSRVEDLMTTGVTTLMIFVIPFNERNVILEEPGLLQGERNIKIVNYLLNRAVNVLVIYQGDVESQKLPANVLYHPHLTSAERHPTLRQLSMRGRFMSINNNFTTHQKQCIQEAINRA